MAEHSQRSSPLLSFNKSRSSPTCNIDFGEVYQQHRLKIYRYSLARVGHVHDAQDITAQVFLKAYRNLSNYRQKVPIIAWLMGITRHQIADYFRGQREHVSLSLLPDIPSSEQSPEESIEHKHQMKRVAQALNALSEDRREAIALRLFAGLKNQEIADLMGKSSDAVAMLVYRGTQDLKTRLSEEE